MTAQPNDTAAGGSAPTRQDEAAVTDWDKVVGLIGTHPDLHLHDPYGCKGWWVKGQRLPDDAPPDAVDWVRARPSTIDGLMLQHCTDWLDQRCVSVQMWTPTMFKVSLEVSGTLPLDWHKRVLKCECVDYPTRIAATIAAVVAAAERGAEG